MLTEEWPATPHVLSHFSNGKLCDPMRCSPADSSAHGVLQTKIPEWTPPSPPGDHILTQEWSLISCIRELQANSGPLSHQENPDTPKALQFEVLLNTVFKLFFWEESTRQRDLSGRPDSGTQSPRESHVPGL